MKDMNMDALAQEVLAEVSKQSLKLKIINLADVNEEPTAFLVDPFIVQNGINLVTAPQKSLKSMLMLCLIISCLNEKDFLNTFKTRKIRKALLIDAENKKSAIKERTLKLGGDINKIVLTDEYIFFDKDEAITDKLRNTIIDEEIDLLVIDTLRRTNLNMDENSSKDVNQFFSRIQPLKDLVTIIVIHHETKPTQLNQRTYFRGSGDLVGAVDSHISIKKGETKDGITKLTLTHENARYSSELAPIEIEFLTDETTFKFNYAGTKTENFIKSIEDEKNERMEQLLEFIKEGNAKGKSTVEIANYCKNTFDIGEHKTKQLRDELIKCNLIIKSNNSGDKKTYFIYFEFAPQQSNILENGDAEEKGT